MHTGGGEEEDEDKARTCPSSPCMSMPFFAPSLSTVSAATPGEEEDEEDDEEEEGVRGVGGVPFSDTAWQCEAGMSEP